MISWFLPANLQTSNLMTDTSAFFQKIRSYGPLSQAAEAEWCTFLKSKSYAKGEDFLRIGQIPRKVAFVLSGLFSQHYISEKGDTVIKYFFPEGRIAGSIPATVTRSESLFDITAIEDTEDLE